MGTVGIYRDDILPRQTMKDVEKKCMENMPKKIWVKEEEDRRTFSLVKAYENFALMETPTGYRRCFKWPELLNIIMKMKGVTGCSS